MGRKLASSRVFFTYKKDIRVIRAIQVCVYGIEAMMSEDGPESILLGTVGLGVSDIPRLLILAISRLSEGTESTSISPRSWGDLDLTG